MSSSKFRPPSQLQQFNGNPRAREEVVHLDKVPPDVVPLKEVVHLDKVPLDVGPLNEEVQLDKVPLDVCATE